MGKPAADKTNQVFGRLTVIRRDATRTGNVYWLCRCVCGNECVVNSSNLNSGKQQSCGCLQDESRIRLPLGRAAFNKLFDRYTRGAAKRDLCWEITKDEFEGMVTGCCNYCGSKPKTSMHAKNQHFNGDFIYNGLDRLNNCDGYTLLNVVTCCPECNWAKGSRSHDAFENWLERVIRFRKGKDAA